MINLLKGLQNQMKKLVQRGYQKLIISDSEVNLQWLETLQYQKLVEMMDNTEIYKSDFKEIYEQSPINFLIWITILEYQDKDTFFFDQKHGTTVLPSILMQDCQIETKIIHKTKSCYKEKKIVFVFFWKHNDVHSNVKIIDYFFYLIKYQFQYALFN
ncbi:hypothetical protein pb186bvf_008804 [Paramecium bursaria]